MSNRAEPINIGVLASGRGSNFQAIIDAIEAGRLDAMIALLVTDRSDATAIDRARRHGVKSVFVDPKAYDSRELFDSAVVAQLKAHQVELVCLAGFMRILTKTILEAFPSRIMNIHPSLLPSFPGLHAQRQAIQYGVKISGATVHFVDDGVDSGPIILQAAVPVNDDDTEESLATRILEQEHQIYPRAVQLFAEGRLKVIGRRVLIEGK
jgi:phosphoribosylglycinamide formyltransferase-1